MNYFTIERYKEMQVRGYLVFPETEKDWLENLAWYEAEGIDIASINKEELEQRKHDLLTFLPEFFHPYIHDGTLKSSYPSEELRAIAQQWNEDYNTRTKEVGLEYRSAYSQTKALLPESAVQLHEKTLHDANVKSFERPSPDTLILILDCSGCYHYFTDVRITFSGVKLHQISDQLVGAYWLYDEIYAAENGFELHVLLDSTLSELTLTAEAVTIEVLPC
ncbi:DUF4085 family protein [Paenibacillus luteus]|uniref:DUF4085 family protein n=1 Tax=Paenibacillus luteus TaxID=2545753 RepID=UPI0011437AB4|nr:DUF4085 family protein [Paenibacillus luteus]